MRETEFDGFHLTTPDEWGEVDQDDGPYEFVKTDGVGALHFSIASFVSGKEPSPTTTSLVEMALELGEAFELGTPTDVREEEGRLLLASVDFVTEENFVRVWYVSDRRNFAKATYVCATADLGAELDEATAIVRSIAFTPYSGG